MSPSPFQLCLAQAYSHEGVPLDRLPYSKAIDHIIMFVHKGTGKAIAPGEAWAALLDLRKRGLLPRVGRKPKAA